MRIDAKAMQFNEKLCEIEQMAKDLLTTCWKVSKRQENGSNGGKKPMEGKPVDW